MRKNYDLELKVLSAWLQDPDPALDPYFFLSKIWRNFF